MGDKETLWWLVDESEEYDEVACCVGIVIFEVTTGRWAWSLSDSFSLLTCGVTSN